MACSQPLKNIYTHSLEAAYHAKGNCAKIRSNANQILTYFVLVTLVCVMLIYCTYYSIYNNRTFICVYSVYYVIQ